MRITRVIPALATAAATLVALAPTATAATPAPTPVGTAALPIIGGGYATDAPWAARLFSNGRQTCSATIIAPTWILTARHCVGGGGLSFRIGSLDQTSGGTVANASGVYNHASSDLSLVKLDRSVSATYSRLGQPGSVSVNQTVQVYGWGATSQCGSEINCQSQFLKVARVVVTGGCRDAYNGSAICARRGDGITAGGDSGGPMMANGIQVGVASTSDRQTTTAYTNVTAYRPWIQSIAGV
ncbi:MULTISPECIES: S1 family peptidase [Streptomyces]|uniref:Trypsin n=1 Tax=Streptomyces tsukubensis (strain DSM 42081 / NBRC 108919 / NRRL 18488 / 9993) TaxID=1114943 RepID=I2NB17_STRT9|nr:MULTISPECIES: trypsin-like serine protease [Streptomyces]AZK97968.1 trypsin [Streptomyces tsukubensis]EIF94214.1 trypsin-like protease [Streptomyces tsukubensis NRRL18488]MYS64463.1 trypsin-like serine protease [Streptomyces sp. SID5473]QKM66108.1 trypsin [Streptomyces tsukubensis NRRL18488]TAI42391.1 trypsin-like serine protease [Streptomyces tsukubensis]